MDEQQFWRSVLRILGTLFLSNLAQIPNVQTAVSTTRGQDSFIVWRPLNLEDLITVRLERMQLQFQVSQIPESNSLKSEFIIAK
jgi:hypothetical protein